MPAAVKGMAMTQIVFPNLDSLNFVRKFLSQAGMALHHLLTSSASAAFRRPLPPPRAGLLVVQQQ
jgi:hypothetical protein